MPGFRLSRLPRSTTGLLLALFSAVAAFAAPTDSLRESFACPPTASRPGIWWFWGESVTTDQGITRDLEALKRAGFGSVVVYEQVFSDPPDALKSLSPEWLARWRFAAAECARLGLSLETNVSGGFVAGGPWITPDLAMQRLVASEIVVEGGKHIETVLPQPATKLDFYRDVAVLAYPTLAGFESPAPIRTCEPAGLDLNTLFDARSDKRVRISPNPSGSPVLVQLDYQEPFTARSLSFSQRPNAKALVIATQMPTSWADDFYGENMRLNPAIGRLEASDDGLAWRTVCTLPAIGYQHDGWTRQTIAFPATTARYFRLNLHDWGRNARAGDNDLLLASVELRGEARIDRWETKSGNLAGFSDPDRTPDYRQNETIDPARIIVLTERIGTDGRLAWDAPPGRWTILRLGRTPTGVKTKHSRPELAGLECDKLSARAVRVQFDNYVAVLLRELTKVPGARLNGVGMDSNEHGSQNWTENFPAEFLRRRGYNLTRHLPAMVGRVVGSREESDRFLYDVRRTIADLMSDEYFSGFQRLCHENGLTLTAQAPGIATCLPSDNIQAKGRTDVPMGEFWMTQQDGTIDCKEAASAAHVYGLPVAAAEAFTGSRADAHPAMMKPLADAALAQGINHFTVLAYVHQPWDDRKPGVTEPHFYLPYQRHNTWWEDSTAFWTSLARSSHMLRQGLPVCDILYHLGNDTPLKIATWRMRPAPPEGFDYDVCGDEVLLNRLSFRNGRLELPEGMGYRLLILAGGNRLTLAAARKLKSLVEAGAVVLGPVKPTGSPSLADGPEGDAEVRRIADELWGAGTPATAGVKPTGAGRMLWGMSPAAALASAGVSRDFEYMPQGAPLDMLFTHRQTPGADIYFVANHRAQARHLTAFFRVSNREPRLWDPVNGTISKPTRWKSSKDGRTEVDLALEAHESVFVVFSENTPTVTDPTAPGTLTGELPIRLTLDGSWQVAFDPRWGAPESTTFDTLIPWNMSGEPGIRHYSGTATYRKTFVLESSPTAGSRTLIDLGRVGVLASVKLNGINLGLVWKPPYAVDASRALRPGRNALEVRVVNTWVNRLIADAALPPEKRLTWTTDNPYRPTDPLQPSGLLGPVSLRTTAKSP